MDGPQEAEPATTRSRSFKRGYVACTSCRLRKARCIIGDEPPCAKCRREHRECQFDQRPKAPKQREAPKWTKSGSRAAPEAQSKSTQSRTGAANDEGAGYNASPSANGERFVQHTTPPLTVVSDDGRGPMSETTSNANSTLYNRVMSTVVTGSNDALDILSDSVRQPDDISSNIPPEVPGQGSFRNGIPNVGPTVMPGGNSGLGFVISSLSEPDDETLDLWDKSRFVRQGWFTAQEAVTYIDLFYEYLAPLTPVMVNQFRDHAAHSRLVVEEAMLCCTILMISSRFFMLPGSGGASRSHFVHHRLWHYCENLIKRTMFGQEKHSTSRIRVIGTIESLMLISDWHPRALHFPPETQGWDEMLISPGYDRRDRKSAHNEEPLTRWREDVFEPAKRANRMSWMLLGMATNLAYEIGVFSNRRQEPSDQPNADAYRKFQAQKLLYIYVTQTATRLGLPSVFPEGISISVSRSAIGDADNAQHRSVSAYMDLDLELTQLSKTASSMFFQSATHLQNQVTEDCYADLLDHFSTSLLRWQDRFNSAAKDIYEPLRDSLLIEYHHLRACTGAVSIQAVVTRASASGLNASSRTPGDGLSAFVTSRDAHFLQEVISDSRRVLQIATMSDFSTQLPYSPARVKISVISASVFLLKALSVGSTNTDVRDALHALDQCTSRLKSSPPDDMDFALRYGALVEKHTAHFRANLTSTKSQIPGDGPTRLPPRESSAEGPDHHMGLDPSATTGSSGHPVNYLDSVNFGFDVGDTWISLPFDSGIAPFSSDCDQLSLGLDVDSLNFLWSLPVTSG